MKFHVLADIFPLMDGQPFDDLVADIRTNGLLEPIWIYEGQILDGRNRFRASKVAGVEYRTRDYTGGDPLGFVISLNLKRRHLNAGQLAALALKIEVIEAERARLRMSQGGGDQKSGKANLPHPIEDKGQAREKAAVAVGASPRNVQHAKKLQSERPDLLAKVETGRLSIHAATRQAEEDKRVANLERPVVIMLPTGIHHGDFRNLSDSIPDSSVELVFTDPPYDADSVTLYEDAARVAARILKPGGSMIAYSGQRHLPQVMSSMARHLSYWWTIACVHEGGNQMLQKLGIRCGWKPLVWFVKGTRGDVQNVLLDTVRGDREKDSHAWQQAQSEAEYYISELCSEGGTVVDFFLGGGTTAAACKSLGRKFIGFEVDASAVERSIARLAA